MGTIGVREAKDGKEALPIGLGGLIAAGRTTEAIGVVAHGPDVVSAPPTCPVRVFKASETSKAVQKYRIGDLERYAGRFGGRVDRQADSGDGWEWEGYQYNHPALKDEDHMGAFESEWDCLCALLEAITKDLIDEGFGPESIEVRP